MFFNFGPFGFGFDEQPVQPQPPRRQQPQPPRNNQGGFFGGMTDFLQEQFMNPFFPPQRHNQPQQRQEEPPRPAFHRTTSKQEKEKQVKKEKKQEKAPVVYSENTGMYWKEKANEELRNHRYETALQFYTKAIQLNNTESIFFSNRSRCYKKIGNLEAALKDAQDAIELEDGNIKAHLLSGQILAEIGKKNKDIRKVTNAVTRLTKALTLCVGQNKDTQFQNQIGSYIYKGKKLLWYLRLEQIKQQRICGINEYKNYLQNDKNLPKQEAQAKLKQFIDASNQSILFQIPDYLTCRITLDLMEDPVVTDSGQVYERSAIQEHIQRNGKTDPFTRKPISGNLYPCIAIKKAVQDFLQKNPWAYEFSEGQSYHDISF